MAISVLTGKDKQYGFAVAVTTKSSAQTVWGTAAADNSLVIELACEPFNIARDVKIRHNPTAQGTRNPVASDFIADTKMSAPTFTMSAMANHNELDHFLYAHFQNVSEEVGTPYAKTFTFPATQPDFTADAGAFYTFFERYPTASYSWSVLDAISKSITLTLEPGEPLKVSQEWISRGAASVTSNPSGTWSRSTKADLWYFSDIDTATIDFGGGAQAVTLTGGCEISLSHDVLPVGHDGSGSFDTFALVNRTGTFKLTILKDAQTQTALTNHAAGIQITAVLRWGDGTADGDLTIDFKGSLEDVVVDNEDVMGAVLTGQIVAAAAAAEPITILVANDVDRTW